MLSMTIPAVTPAEATVYLDASGATGWPVETSLQAEAILRAQRHIAARYNGRWTDVLNPVPAPVTYAIIEAALIEARTPGFFTRTYTPSEAKVLTEVKGIKWTLVGGNDMTPTSTIVDALLAPYMARLSGIGLWAIG